MPQQLEVQAIGGQLMAILLWSWELVERADETNGHILHLQGLA